MKKIFGLLAAFVMFAFIGASNVSAGEGNIDLSSSNVSCKGVVVWQESSYKITGRCQGLVYPYATQLEHYALWAKLDNGNYVRIDDIDRGYFEGAINSDFDSLYVTAESSSSPRRPSDKTIVSGNVDAFDFGTTKTTAVQPTPTPAATTAPTGNTGMTVQSATTAATATTANVSSVISKILKSLLVIVAVIILITVVASLLFRKRGSVSA